MISLSGKTHKYPLFSESSNPVPCSPEQHEIPGFRDFTLKIGVEVQHIAFVVAFQSWKHAHEPSRRCLTVDGPFFVEFWK